MDGNAFTLGEELNSRKLTYILSDHLRRNFVCDEIDLDFINWQSIKYLNDDATQFSNEINTIPNRTGGLYLFYLPCHIIPSMTEFPFYVGRAKCTGSQNLRKRVKEYYQHYNNEVERPKIYRMLRIWGPVLRVAFYPLTDNDRIETIERDLINSLLLPMNDKIPDKNISQAVKAFQP